MSNILNYLNRIKKYKFGIFGNFGEKIYMEIFFFKNILIKLIYI